MKLYEINAQLEALLEQTDPETGELTCDMDALAALMIARDEKLEGLALYTKNLAAEAAAIREEEKRLAERRKVLENKAERTKEWLRESLAGETIKTARVAVSYRSSKAVELDGTFYTWMISPEAEPFIRRKDPEPDKTEIAKALKAGAVIPGASLVDHINMTIR